jgi:hypothetical protein
MILKIVSFRRFFNFNSKHYLTQIYTWKYILKSSSGPVFWNFDATGSILKPVPNQKRPFLYSMAYHDKEKKQILTIFDFNHVVIVVILLKTF